MTQRVQQRRGPLLLLAVGSELPTHGEEVGSTDQDQGCLQTKVSLASIAQVLCSTPMLKQASHCHEYHASSTTLALIIRSNKPNQAILCSGPTPPATPLQYTTWGSTSGTIRYCTPHSQVTLSKSVGSGSTSWFGPLLDRGSTDEGGVWRTSSVPARKAATGGKRGHQSGSPCRSHKPPTSLRASSPSPARA